MKTFWGWHDQQPPDAAIGLGYRGIVQNYIRKAHFNASAKPVTYCFLCCG